MPILQQELTEQTAKLESLQRRAEKAEAALAEAKISFEQEKQAWKAELQPYSSLTSSPITVMVQDARSHCISLAFPTLCGGGS